MQLLDEFRKYGHRAYKISRASLLVNFIAGSFQRDAIFVHVPKTAGTTLREILKIRMLKSPIQVYRQFPDRGRITFGHIAVDQLVEYQFISESFYRRSFKFAFVRDPFPRAVSLFQYLKSIKKLDPDLTFLDFCRTLSEGITPVGLYNFRGLSHCNPQSRWLESVDLDYLGRIENFEQDVERIADRLGVRVPAELPRRNPSANPEFRSFYCPESEEIVRRFYQDDFRNYGYPTTLPR